MTRRPILSWAVVSLTLATAGVGATPALGATVLATGTLTDAKGSVTPGTVQVFASLPAGGVMPLLGTGKAGPDGEFTVTATDSAQLLRLADANGWLDYRAVAYTGGRVGQWLYTGHVSSQGGEVRSASPEEVVAHSARGSAAGAAASPPQITLKADRPVPARASQVAGDPNVKCKTETEEKPVESRRSLAIVGELNNAYNDGTVGKFTYGRGSTSSSYFGVAISNNSGESFSIGGEKYLSESGSTTFPPAKKRYARKLRSLFEFTKREARLNTCAKFDIEIRPTAWIGGHNDRLRQRGALDQCDPKQLQDGFRGTGDFHRERNDATRWNRGAQAFGADITVRSGFDRHVQLDYKFGGPSKKQHWLCGPDGKQSPFSSGRVYSGAR